MVNTRQIRRVTGTLQRVSAARLPADRRAVKRSSLYTSKLTAVVQELSAAAPEADHPFLRPAERDGPAAVVVFGSERGLCGGFNGNLATRYQELLLETPGAPPRAIAVGKVINRRLLRMGAAVDLFVPQPTADNRRNIMDQIFSFLEAGYRQGNYREVYVLRNHSFTFFQQTPTLEKMLPVAMEAAADVDSAVRVFEPGPEKILVSLLPEYVRQMLDHAFLQSLEAEDAARQTSMARATENAGKIMEDLRRKYSRIRQENITTEMIELAGGGMT